MDGERTHAVEGRGLAIDGAGGRPGGAPGELVLADLIRGQRGDSRVAAEERGEMGDPGRHAGYAPDFVFNSASCSVRNARIRGHHSLKRQLVRQSPGRLRVDQQEALFSLTCCTGMTTVVVSPSGAPRASLRLPVAQSVSVGSTGPRIWQSCPSIRADVWVAKSAMCGSSSCATFWTCAKCFDESMGTGQVEE